jgi:hypothetical protein
MAVQSLSRRNLLVATAASGGAVAGIGVLANPAPAAPPAEDPIFQLIEQHKAAEARYAELARQEDRCQYRRRRA